VFVCWSFVVFSYISEEVTACLFVCLVGCLFVCWFILSVCLPCRQHFAFSYARYLATLLSRSTSSRSMHQASISIMLLYNSCSFIHHCLLTILRATIAVTAWSQKTNCHNSVFAQIQTGATASNSALLGVFERKHLCVAQRVLRYTHIMLGCWLSDWDQLS
jgi:hypothetical protein